MQESKSVTRGKSTGRMIRLDKSKIRLDAATTAVKPGLRIKKSTIRLAKSKQVTEDSIPLKDIFYGHKSLDTGHQVSVQEKPVPDQAPEQQTFSRPTNYFSEQLVAKSNFAVDMQDGAPVIRETKQADMPRWKQLQESPAPTRKRRATAKTTRNARKLENGMSDWDEESEMDEDDLNSTLVKHKREASEDYNKFGSTTKSRARVADTKEELVKSFVSDWDDEDSPQIVDGRRHA